MILERVLIIDRVYASRAAMARAHTHTHTWRRRMGVQWRWWLVVPFRVADGVVRCWRLCCCRRPVRRRAGGRGCAGALEPEEAIESERERHVEQQQRADQHQLHVRRRQRRASAAARCGLHAKVKSSVACTSRFSLPIRSFASIRSYEFTIVDYQRRRLERIQSNIIRSRTITIGGK